MAGAIRKSILAVLVLWGAPVRGQIAPPGGAAIAPPPAGGVMAPPGTEAAPARAPASAGAGAAVRAGQPLTTDALLGSVNADPIFAGDVFDTIDGDLRALGQHAKSEDEFRLAARSVIQRRFEDICWETASVQSIRSSLSDEDKRRVEVFIDGEREKLKGRYGGSKAAADQALAREGTSVDREMTKLRRAAMMDLYRQREIYPRIVITQPMLREEYDRDPKNWREEESLELNMLALPVTRWLRQPGAGGALGPVMANPTAAQIKGAEAQALATGDEIVAKLTAGADFAQLSEDYNSRDEQRNTGGRYPHLTRGSLASKALEDHVFALRPDTIGKPFLVSDPDPAKEAVVVAKVDQKTPARVISFQEAQGRIHDKLYREQYEALRNAAVKKLLGKSTVEAMNADLAVDVAVARYFTKP